MSTSPNQASAGTGRLGLWDAVGIIVGIVIGATIYQMPAAIFSNAADPYWGLGVWLIGGLVALIGAFCYAELAATHPRAGGDYYYLTKSFGPTTGFLFGWAQLVVLMPASIGIMAYVFADFLQQGFVPKEQPLVFDIPVGDKIYSFPPSFAIGAIAVLVLTFLNVLGVVLGKTVQNLLTAAKIIGLGGIVVAGFGWGVPDAWEHTTKEISGRTAPFIPALGSLALIFVLYAYGGWNDSAFVAAEVRDPSRNIPRALLLGVGIITLVYLLVNAAYINGLGWSNVNHDKAGKLPALVIERTPLKDWGFKGMCALIMVSALGAANGLIFTGARVYATLGADHKLFGWMGHWRPGRGSPIMALLLQAILTVFIVAAITTKEGQEKINQGLAYVNDGVVEVNKFIQRYDENREIPLIDYDKEWKEGAAFESLVARTAPVFWFFFMFTGFSLFIMRDKFKDTPRPFSAPLYPLVPILFCLACAWMLYQAIDYVKWHALFAVVMVLLGLPFYWISRLLFGIPDDDTPLSLHLPPRQPPPREPPKEPPRAQVLWK